MQHDQFKIEPLRYFFLTMSLLLLIKIYKKQNKRLKMKFTIIIIIIVCVCACVRVCVRACVHVCVCGLAIFPALAVVISLHLAINHRCPDLTARCCSLWCEARSVPPLTFRPGKHRLKELKPTSFFAPPFSYNITILIKTSQTISNIDTNTD